MGRNTADSSAAPTASARRHVPTDRVPPAAHVPAPRLMQAPDHLTGRPGRRGGSRRTRPRRCRSARGFSSPKLTASICCVGHAERGQRAAHGLGALLAERQVVLAAAALVGVALHDDLARTVRREEARVRLDRAAVLVLDHEAVEVEVDAALGQRAGRIVQRRVRIDRRRASPPASCPCPTRRRRRRQRRPPRRCGCRSGPAVSSSFTLEPQPATQASRSPVATIGCFSFIVRIPVSGRYRAVGDRTCHFARRPPRRLADVAGRAR